MKSVFKKKKKKCENMALGSPACGFLEGEAQSTCKCTDEINVNRNSTLCSRLDIDILKETTKKKIHVVLIICMSVPNTHFQLASYAYGKRRSVW